MTTSDPNWFAEIELRRYLRDKYPEAEWNRRRVPTAPDPQVAEWRLETDYPGVGDEDRERQSVDTHAPDGIEVDTDKIVVPLETVQQVNQNELIDFLRKNVLDGMAVDERHQQGSTFYVMGDRRDSNYGFVDYNELSSDSLRVEDPRPVYVQVPPDHQLCRLNEIWEKRRRQSRDLKMLITARDSQTGTGKTTLAVALAKSWDEHGWSADKATLSPQEYVDTYTQLKSGEILIGDEMEQMADPRRSMSEQNITLTQYWSTMRQWEVSTICTLPSAAMVDKRLRELMDIRLNVQRRGIAVAYEKKIDDHSGKVKEKRLHRVRWNALDDDEDYGELAEMKKRHMENFNETAYFASDDAEEEQPDPEEAVQKYRNERIQQAYTEDFTQSDIAEIFDISRPRVSQILSESD